jgi:hypothetical protein
MSMKRIGVKVRKAVFAVLAAFVLSIISAAGVEAYTALKNYYFPPSLDELRK